MNFATQSRFSDPGRHGDWLDDTPADIAALRDIASGLVFHHWAGGDPTAHGFEPSRLAEVDLRYAEAMLGRLRELDPTLSGAPRRPTDRILGCCRDFTLLYVTLLRHHRIPARTRVGFADYLLADWHLDHVVAEVWDGSRWRLVDPQFPADNALPVDVLDVPRDRFLVAPDAWRALRSGVLDPSRVVVAPDLVEPFLRGLPYARHNLALDIAALNQHEMLLWDIWGGMNLDPTVSPSDASRADELAALAPSALQAAFADDDLRVPPVIQSLSPTTHTLAEVSLRS
ncbi:transglutaminase-like domain-containing protein [Kutzneria sp. 744]|uniref:transglutaminase-like domain-containing protein n=1 Tax=Kutzneria sp. (strain 744) TaxID=345341 RepID=UPI0003EED83A|nr:transglutaminase-like domain-containing protein [Kutzneria sp. 744]EWM12294.1 mucin-2 [Kutzneria sp. 744]